MGLQWRQCGLQVEFEIRLSSLEGLRHRFQAAVLLTVKLEQADYIILMCT